MNERMLDCGAIIAVLPEQGRVGSVQSCDNLRRAISNHLPRQKSGDGVRHGVVHVKNIECFRAPDLRHLYRQRQCVIGTRKQLVFIHRDLMKKNSRRSKIEPYRFCVAEEMDLVPARCQLTSKCAGKDAASADEREASDAKLKFR